MPTLLVTGSMSPSLAARVQAAVSGQSQPKMARKSRLKAGLRLLAFAALFGGVASALHLRQKRVEQLDQRRAELLSELMHHSEQLSHADRALPGRVTAAIAEQASAVYAGDVVSPELRTRAQLNEALGAPTLYLRGPLDGLARPERVGELASSSSKDAFLLCLLDPPVERSEQALRLKASAAYAQGPSMLATSHVERVAPLLQVVPLLGSEWKARVRMAENVGTLEVLSRVMNAAPLQAAIRSAKSRQLLLVLDETATGSGPTELDGERAHAVRVALVDLTSGEARLRFRGKVDPSAFSDQGRIKYASGLDGCALALDLRTAVEASK